jgi:hypothetical protein
LLAAWLVLAVAREEVTIRRWPLGRLTLGLLGGVAMGATVGLIAAAVVLPAPVRWPCLIMAPTIATGTLLALVRFHRAATLPAVSSLVATWTVAMVLAGEWLLPAMEPYRLSRIVGERLAVLTRERKVEPVLLTFQEPSTIYAYGRPVPTIRVWKDFFDQLDRHGAVIAPLLPNELRTIRKIPAVEVEVCDRLTGFNLSKGTTQTLQFTVVRSKRGVAQRARGEQPIVK